MAGTQPPERPDTKHWALRRILNKSRFKNISSPPGQSFNQTKQAQGTHLTQTQCFNIIRLKDKKKNQ